MRVELGHRHFLVKVAADFLENLLKNLRVEKKRRAEVEAIAIALDERGASADARLLLKNGHIRARLGEQHGRGQPARPCSNNDDTSRHKPSLTK